MNEFEQLISEYEEMLNLKLNKLEEVEKAEESLHEFLRQAWHVIEPDTFVDNWHLDALSEHLEALLKRDIKNLLINIPPRTGKSTLISAAVPAWQWIHKPEERFVYASHSQKLSQKHSLDCRNIITSQWYQSRWGHLYSLEKDQNSKMRFNNDKSGYRISTSVGSSFTGDGGSALFCFPYETEIPTDRGRLLIGDIVFDKLPVKVLSYNHKDEVVEYKEIENYQMNGIQEIIEIELEDRIIQCTEDHPIFVRGKGYIEAKNIQNGDLLYCL